MDNNTKASIVIKAIEAESIELIKEGRLEEATLILTFLGGMGVGVFARLYDAINSK